MLGKFRLDTGEVNRLMIFIREVIDNLNDLALLVQLLIIYF